MMSKRILRNRPDAPRNETGLARYRQIYVRLKTQIIEGVWPEMAALPSEPELASRFGVSRVTIRHALGLLEADGLVERRHGSGTFVTPQPDGDNSPALEGPLENLITLGVQTDAVTLSAEALPATGRPAEALALSSGDVFLKITRQRSANREPFSFTMLYVPENLAALVDVQALDDRPLVSILETKGIIAERAEQTLAATLAEFEAAEALNVSVGSPLTRLRRTVYDPAGKPFLHQVSLYRPDLFEYRMTLARNQFGPGPAWSHT